jgi:hypothetical protein
MACTFLWGKEQGDIGLKDILSYGNSEASDGGVGRPARGVTSLLVAVDPMGEKSGRAVVGEGLKRTCHWEQCELAGETVV